jgi:glycosyltransferase involved in cell wall biosynthesis
MQFFAQHPILRKAVRAMYYPVQWFALQIRLRRLDRQLSLNKHNDKPPVLLLSHEFTATGAVILLLKIGEQFAHEGYPIVFLSPFNAAPSPFIRDLLSYSSGIFYCQPRERICNILLRHLSRKGISRCIGNTVITGAFAPHLAKYGIKSIYLIHEMWASCMILNAQSDIRAICAQADHIVFPASAVMESFMRLAEQPAKGQVHCFPQGYYKKSNLKLSREEAREKLLHQLHLPENAFILVGAGTLTFGKGFDMLLLIAAQMISMEARTNRPTHILWLGESKGTPYEHWLDVHIRLAGLEDRVHRTGFIAEEDEYLACLQGSDVFAMVSREDAFPSVLLEALFVGLPIVAFSGSGGGAQLVQDGMGYTVPFANIDAYCQQLVWVQQHPEDIAAQVKRTRQKSIIQFDFSNYVHRLLEILA